jgi:hypothetical protein
MENLEDISIKVFEAIFLDSKNVIIDDVEYPIKIFSSSRLKYVDYFGYRFVEQNPRKQSQWAKKAREGHKIIWVFKGRRYTAQVFDGKFKDLRKEKI